MQNLDLVTIRSLTPRNQLLKPLSWQVAGGLERVPGEDGDENLVSHLNGGAGGSWMFGDDLLLYAMGTARIENNRTSPPPSPRRWASTAACCGATRWAT